MNRPVRSPRISVGQECGAALAPARDTTVGAGGSGEEGVAVAGEQVLSEEIMLMSHPLRVVGGVGQRGAHSFASQRSTDLNH